MRLTICSENISELIELFVLDGILPENWIDKAGYGDEYKYFSWSNYFQVKTNNVAELEDLLEASIENKATHYILERDNIGKVCDETPLPKFKGSRKNRWS